MGVFRTRHLKSVGEWGVLLEERGEWGVVPFGAVPNARFAPSGTTPHSPRFLEGVEGLVLRGLLVGGPTFTFSLPTGLSLSWESAWIAPRRSGVRAPSAPWSLAVRG